MKLETTYISGRECRLLQQSGSKYLLIQPVDEHETDLLEEETDRIRSLCKVPFCFVSFRINDWNQELTPWPSPPVFGKTTLWQCGQ